MNKHPQGVRTKVVPPREGPSLGKFLTWAGLGLLVVYTIRELTASEPPKANPPAVWKSSDGSSA